MALDLPHSDLHNPSSSQSLCRLFNTDVAFKGNFSSQNGGGAGKIINAIEIPNPKRKRKNNATTSQAKEKADFYFFVVTGLS